MGWPVFGVTNTVVNLNPDMSYNTSVGLQSTSWYQLEPQLQSVHSTNTHLMFAAGKSNGEGSSVLSVSSTGTSMNGADVSPSIAPATLQVTNGKQQKAHSHACISHTDIPLDYLWMDYQDRT
jgi:hypothetical protein